MNLLHDALEVAVSKAKIQGEGQVTLPDSPVPPVTFQDMGRNAAEDYEEANDYEWPRDTEILQAWIRRAVHAEAFARALEAELEKERTGASHG